jgi:predicted GIY-YIG superfamily endonuclease
MKNKKEPKDGKYTVYRLPNADNYVGVTGCLSRRMKEHKSHYGRDVSVCITEGVFENMREALDFEKALHNKGFNGKRDYSVYNHAEITRKTNFEARSKKFHKPIIQYTLDSKFVKEWNCAKDIVNTLGISAPAISRCCTNKQASTRGFIWKFKEQVSNNN